MSQRRSFAAATAAPRGFTLVEVLVAIFVLAVMAGMAWQGVDAITRSRSVAQGSVDRTLRIGSVLAQWQADLRALHTSTNVPGPYFANQITRIVRSTDSGVQVVVWSARGGRLLRWASPSTTRVAELNEMWLRSQQLLGNEEQQFLMLDGVSSWQTYCHDGSPNVNNCESTQNNLPLGVRLVLQFAGENAGSITRDTALPTPLDK